MTTTYTDAQPVALDELVRGASGFRNMMMVFSDEYVRAVSGGMTKQYLAAIRAYIDLVEVSMPETAKRKDLPQ